MVDDHHVVREGLRLLIEQQPDMEVGGEAGDRPEALRLLTEMNFDLVIMDLSLRGTGGLVLLREMLQQYPQQKIIVLSALLDSKVIQSAFKAGLHGYVLKTNSPQELIWAIRAVLAGKRYLCPEVAASVMELIQGEEHTAPNCEQPHLSTRELEVLKLTAEGLRAKEIAGQLHIGVRTVETYRARLMSKLGCNSKVELTRYAIRKGIACT